MDKAIKTLERFKKAFELYVNDNKVPDAHKKQWESDIVDLKESLIELQAYKANIESLKLKYEKDIRYLDFQINTCIFTPAKQAYMLEKTIYTSIVSKLEELDK